LTAGQQFFLQATMKRAIFLISLVLASCSFGSGNLQSRRVTDLESRRIHRIAVMPPNEETAPLPRTIPGTSEPRNPERDAGETLTRIIYSVMAAMPNWQIVSDNEVREISQGIAATPGDPARLRQIGEMVYADAVLVSHVRRYRERVGDEWGAKSPASVGFVLDLIDVRRGDTVWSASFDETQKSLSENIFALGDITQRGVRWLSADQLAQEGVKKALAQLHDMIARAPAS
jgi:TolB-like protein